MDGAVAIHRQTRVVRVQPDVRAEATTAHTQMLSCVRFRGYTRLYAGPLVVEREAPLQRNSVAVLVVLLLRLIRPRKLSETSMLHAQSAGATT